MIRENISKMWTGVTSIFSNRKSLPIFDNVKVKSIVVFFEILIILFIVMVLATFGYITVDMLFFHNVSLDVAQLIFPNMFELIKVFSPFIGSVSSVIIALGAYFINESKKREVANAKPTEKTKEEQ